MLHSSVPSQTDSHSFWDHHTYLSFGHMYVAASTITCSSLHYYKGPPRSHQDFLSFFFFTRKHLDCLPLGVPTTIECHREHTLVVGIAMAYVYHTHLHSTHSKNTKHMQTNMHHMHTPYTACTACTSSPHNIIIITVTNGPCFQGGYTSPISCQMCRLSLA